MKKYAVQAQPDHINICRADERGRPDEVVYKLAYEESLQFQAELLNNLNEGAASCR